MNLRSRSWLTPIVLGWTGMRGVVSLAAALSIPLTINGEAFPHRNLILFITFVAILLTLVVQGLTLPFIIEKFKPFSGLVVEVEKENGTRKIIKTDLKQHIYNHVKSIYDSDIPAWEGHIGMQRVLKHWEDQSNTQDIRWIDDKTKVLLLEIFEMQRNYLHNLNLDANMDEEIIRHHIYQIDLEEERIRFV